ncbi:MAG: hypothetical protein K6G81_13030 [Lachnospiraceae bacterium]|nr:hypothetical protein [Lachnospiraceae bacterium]
MEGGEKVIYEALGMVEGSEEPMRAYFDSVWMAVLWLSDFYDGGICRMVIAEPRPDNEEIIRGLGALDDENG